MKVAAFHFSQWFNSPCLPEGGSVKTWDDGRGRRRINGGQTIHRIHRYFFGLDSLSLPPQHTFPLALHRRRQCCRRATQEGLNCSTARAWGRWDGGRPSSVRGHRSFGISPGDGGGGGSEVLLLRLRSRLISAAAASLSVLVHICVRLSWWKSALVRSPFLLVFRLYLFLIARSSSSFLLRSISFSLFPFFAPYVIIGSLGPSEAGAGADTAVSAVVPEDALDAAIHDVCVFRHYQVNADADRKFECAVRNEIGESLKLDYIRENAEREKDGRGGVGPRLALVRFISSEESGQREPTAWPQSAKSARNSRFLSLLRELPICRDCRRPT